MPKAVCVARAAASSVARAGEPRLPGLAFVEMEDGMLSAEPASGQIKDNIDTRLAGAEFGFGTANVGDAHSGKLGEVLNTPKLYVIIRHGMLLDCAIGRSKRRTVPATLYPVYAEQKAEVKKMLRSAHGGFGRKFLGQPFEG
jgi:hypothetical protein